MADQPKSLSQDDIDALIGEFGGASPEPAAKTDAAAPAAPPAPGKDAQTVVQSPQMLGQDDIDALLNAEVEQQAAAPAQAPATKPVARPDHLTKSVPAAGTKRIEDILASMENTATLKAQAHVAGAQPEASGPLGQDDIDRLLAELGASAPVKATTKKIAHDQAGGTKPVVTASQTQKPATATATNVSSDTAPLTKSPTATQVGVPGAEAKSTASGTLALSPEDIDALVNKQVGVESEHGEAPMIDQGDIDALVKQLATATGAPDTKRISDALAKHEGEIDKLLEKAGDPKSTVDAVEVGKLTATPASGRRAMPAAAMVAAGPAVAVMAPTELRGARWLLAVAVLFLGMCSATLVIVVNAINSLSHELHETRRVDLVTTDSFGDDLKAALAKLASSDDGEVTKGVLFLQRLKTRHPNHAADIALTLARHFRAHQAHHQAVEEFASLSDDLAGAFDDPRVPLDYADSLAHIGEEPAALREIYTLLANEDSYLGNLDRHGLARPADEISRNKQALADAYLSLGRLLSNKANTPTAGEHTAAAHPGAAHAAEGEGKRTTEEKPAAAQTGEGKPEAHGAAAPAEKPAAQAEKPAATPGEKPALPAAKETAAPAAEPKP